jgi:hypothetical protein
MPLILNIESVYSGSYVDCCNLCWSNALGIKFDVVVRKTKTRTTVRLCYVCCRNVYGISNNALKEYENSTKIHALTSQREMFEAQHLSMHHINPYKIQKDMQCDF